MTIDTQVPQPKITDVARSELEKRFNRLVGASATNLCTHCGWCIDSCHVYLATGDIRMSPVAKADLIRRHYKRSHDWMSKIFPKWTGARKEITEDEFDEWVEAAFMGCTLCERCVVNCPMGVETPQLLAAARGTLTAIGKAPEILDQLADAAMAREEHLDMFKDIFLEQIRGLEDEVRAKTGIPDARIPVDEPADMLYVPLSGAHTIVPQAIVFNMVGASWSLSLFDASNYAMFLADIPRAKKIAMRVINEAERLGVKELVISECGHAYAAFKWEAPKWFGGPLPFKVRSIVEVLDEYVQDGLLDLDPSLNPEAITYHDPCNLGRKGGIFEQPRRVVQASSTDYREMTPNRTMNYCCGGGGGLVAELDWAEQRILFGKPKAEQIRDTGATKVITSCDNCRHQIDEIGKHYGHEVVVQSVSELLVDALVTSNSPAAAPVP
jgi:Fe-S oxidoreductase